MSAVYTESWETARYFWELNWKVVSVTTIILTFFFTASEWLSTNYGDIFSYSFLIITIDLYLITCLITILRNSRRIQRKLTLISKLEQLMGLSKVTLDGKPLLPSAYIKAGSNLRDFLGFEFILHLISLAIVNIFGFLSYSGFV